jgi:hypothetical protein
MGIASGSSGASFARRSDFSTAERSAASVVSFVWTTVLLAEPALHGHAEIRDRAGGRHLVVGEAHVGRVAAADLHIDAIGFRHGNNALNERLRFLAREDRAVRGCPLFFDQPVRLAEDFGNV